MRKLILILICLMVAGSALGADDDTAFGAWNEAGVIYSVDCESYWAGGCYAFPNVAGTDTTLDSTSIYVLCDTADKYVSLALYRIKTGTGIYFVDSTGPLLVTASNDTQWVTLQWISDSALLRDTVYVIAVKAESAGGVFKWMRYDSTGTGLAIRTDPHAYTDAWETPTWGGTSNTANKAQLSKNYYGTYGESPSATPATSKVRQGKPRQKWR